MQAFFEIFPWASIAMAALILANIIVSLWTVFRSTKKVFGAYAGLVPLNQVYTYYLENYIDSYHSGKDIRLYDQKSLICSEMEHLLANGMLCSILVGSINSSRALPHCRDSLCHQWKGRAAFR